MKKNCQCNYCVATGGYPHVFEVPDRDWLWVDIPKNASYVIKQNYKMEFVTGATASCPIPNRSILHQVEEIDKPVYFIYRDPVERFISTFCYYFIPGNHDAYMGADWLGVARWRRPAQWKLEFLLDNIDTLPEIEMYHHWLPQSHFVGDWDLKKLVFKQHRLHDYFDMKIMYANETRKAGFTLNENHIAKVKEIYADDYRLDIIEEV